MGKEKPEVLIDKQLKSTIKEKVSIRVKALPYGC